MAGSDSVNHCCMKCVRSIVINEKGVCQSCPRGNRVRSARPALSRAPLDPSGQGTTCLRVFFALRSRGKLACFMACIFSAGAYIKHTTEGVLQSFPSHLPKFQKAFFRWFESNHVHFSIPVYLKPLKGAKVQIEFNNHPECLLIRADESNFRVWVISLYTTPCRLKLA